MKRTIKPAAGKSRVTPVEAAKAARPSKPIAIVTQTYLPVSEEEIERLEQLIRDLRSGETTAFAWVSARPEFARYGGGFVQTHMDRLAIMAALQMKIRQVQDLEIQEFGI